MKIADIKSPDVGLAILAVGSLIYWALLEVAAAIRSQRTLIVPLAVTPAVEAGNGPIVEHDPITPRDDVDHHPV